MYGISAEYVSWATFDSLYKGVGGTSDVGVGGGVGCICVLVLACMCSTSGTVWQYMSESVCHGEKSACAVM